MLKRFFHILKGWGKSMGILSVSTAGKKLSDLRLSICKNCPESSTSKVLELLNGSANYVNELKCNKCTCPCLQKTLVIDEKCPIGKW